MKAMPKEPQSEDVVAQKDLVDLYRSIDKTSAEKEAKEAIVSRDKYLDFIKTHRRNSENPHQDEFTSNQEASFAQALEGSIEPKINCEL